MVVHRDIALPERTESPVQSEEGGDVSIGPCQFLYSFSPQQQRPFKNAAAGFCDASQTVHHGKPVPRGFFTSSAKCCFDAQLVKSRELFRVVIHEPTTTFVEIKPASGVVFDLSDLLRTNPGKVFCIEFDRLSQKVSGPMPQTNEETTEP